MAARLRHTELRGTLTTQKVRMQQMEVWIPCKKVRQHEYTMYLQSDLHMFDHRIFKIILCQKIILYNECEKL